MVLLKVTCWNSLKKQDLFKILFNGRFSFLSQQTCKVEHHFNFQTSKTFDQKNGLVSKLNSFLLFSIKTELVVLVLSLIIIFIATNLEKRLVFTLGKLKWADEGPMEG